MLNATSSEQVVIHVAVGVIVKNNRVLLAQRAKHQHQGGLWEFPGGKVESTEHVTEALVRELQEELAITATQMHPLIQIHHDYGDKTVLLDVWIVKGFDGCPKGLEGQPLKWVEVDDLKDYAFPAANQPIVSAITLPQIMAITPSEGGNDQLLDFCCSAVDAGARGIYLRSLHLTKHEVSDLLSALSGLQDTRVWLSSRHVFNSDGQIDDQLLAKVYGVNFTASDLALIPRLTGMDKSLTASCHDLEELEQAQQAGADAVYLSPVCPTTSHPNEPTLGWTTFSKWVLQAKVPVYALGGMGLDDLPIVLSQYGQGIAGISLFSSDRSINNLVK